VFTLQVADQFAFNLAAEGLDLGEVAGPVAGSFGMLGVDGAAYGAD